MSSARSGLYGVARLRPGITAVAAKAEMQSIVHATSGYGVTIEPLLRFVTGEAAPALRAAFAAVLLLLAIACTNVALLLLVRGAARARDLAVRAALGGGHGRVALQQMAEGVLLALAGGALGLLLAVWAVDGLAVLAPAGIPRLREVRVDWRMAGFALLASLLSGALAGLVSAWRALRSDLFLLLKEGGAFATAGSGRSRARDGLVVAQLALALLLAAGAGLLLRSLQRLMAVPLGLDTQDVVATLVYPQQQTRADATAGLLAAARAIPGVESAALVGYLPLDPSRGWDDSFDVEGRSASDTNPDVASVNWFSPGYLETVGIRLLKGRDLSTADGAGSAPVAVVNETFARRYLSGREPIGARFASYDWPGISRVIVGVIQDVRQWGPAERSLPEVYLPQLQFAQHGQGDGEAMLVIKSRLPPGRLEAALRETAASLSSQLLLAGTRPLDADSSWVWRWASPRRPSDWRRWACMA